MNSVKTWPARSPRKIENATKFILTASNINSILINITIIFFLLRKIPIIPIENIIVVLMSIELILLAVNINLVSFSIYLDDIAGQVFTLFILTVAAAEAAIGLAIIVVYYRNAGTITVEDIDKLKG